MMLERQQNDLIKLKIYIKKYVLLLFDSASAINFVKPLACQRRYWSTIFVSATLYTFIAETPKLKNLKSFETWVS